MRVFTFLFLLVCSPAFAQPGTIRVKRADTVPQPVQPPRVIWLGFEGFRGLERFGQAFWPVNVNEDPLLLRRGWGLTVATRHPIPMGGGRMMLESTLSSGISMFQLHERKKAFGVPLTMSLGFFPGNFLGLGGTIGARCLFGGDDPGLDGNVYLETGFWLSIDPFFYKGRRFRPTCMPIYTVQYKQIGPHKFASMQVDMPLIKIKPRPARPPQGPNRDGF